MTKHDRGNKFILEISLCLRDLRRHFFNVHNPNLIFLAKSAIKKAAPKKVAKKAAPKKVAKKAAPKKVAKKAAPKKAAPKKAAKKAAAPAAAATSS